MLTLLAVAGAVQIHTGHGAAGIIAFVLSMLILGVTVYPYNTALTQVKNSGILRYTYGGTLVGGPQFGAISGQNTPGEAAGTLIQVLGPNALVSCDSDYHIFGLCPGYAAVTGNVNTLFTGSNLLQADGVAPANRVANSANQNGQFNQYIPGGTKVHAYFQLTNALLGTSTVIAEQPVMLVQTEVQTNRIFHAGVADANGPQYVSSIRVAIKNMGAATTKAAGVLIIELQHSEHDLLGNNTQSANYSTSDAG